MQLFDYAIIVAEKKNKDGETVEKAYVAKRGDVLAKDLEKATLIAGRDIPEDLLEDLERVTLAVRPF
jgi:hypothetical protein